MTYQPHDFNFINTIPGWCSPEKAAVMANLISERKPLMCVEIGIFGGRSIIPMAMAIRDNKLGVVWGIDPFSVAAATEAESGENKNWWTKAVDLEKIYIGFTDAVVKQNLTSECRWIRATSDEGISMFPDYSIDFLHQDSNHSEVVSCREVSKWSKKMSAKSIWILDDANWPSQAKAIQMIKESGFSVLSDFGSYMVFERK